MDTVRLSQHEPNPSWQVLSTAETRPTVSEAARIATRVLSWLGPMEHMEGWRNQMMNEIRYGQAIVVRGDSNRLAGYLGFYPLYVPELPGQEVLWITKLFADLPHKRLEMGTVLVEKMIELYPQHHIVIATGKEATQQMLLAHGFVMPSGFSIPMFSVGAALREIRAVEGTHQIVTPLQSELPLLYIRPPQDRDSAQ